MRPRVLIADDHALILDAFAKLMAEECDIVGKVSDGRAAVEAASQLRPDLVVLDVTMPILNGLDAARQIRRKVPLAKILFVTMTEDADVAAEAFRAGASGYLLKRSAGAELMSAISEVMQGRSYVTPLVTEDLLRLLLRSEDQPGQPELTDRQREILQLLAEGRSMKEVGSLLNLAPRTIAFHKYRMMEQLGVKSTAEMIQYAIKHHIV
ncbi:MAG TPA: response regulator transcription factor [Vicinamibacterales bacterium]|nr:response regulator transcription factor [Vicinamibacterales bacterium]